MIRMDGVTVRFGGVAALDNLSATLSASIVGLVGPNGAGKTTLLNVISGFVKPTSGQVSMDGETLAALSPAARARRGMRRTFQQECVVEDLTLEDNVRAAADHLCRRDAAGDIQMALALTGMSDSARCPGRTLTLYQRRMTEIAKTLVGQPSVILMDEPGAGLDDIESTALRHVIAAIPAAVGGQVVLIDHDTALIASICIETLVLDFGRALAHGPTQATLNDPAVRRAYLGERPA